MKTRTLHSSNFIKWMGLVALLALVVGLAHVPVEAHSSRASFAPDSAPAKQSTPPVAPDASSFPDPDPGTESPVMFIENVGQFEAPVRFYAQGAKHTLWLSDDALWVVLVEQESSGAGAQERRGERRREGVFAPYVSSPVEAQEIRSLSPASGKVVVLKLRLKLNLEPSFPDAGPSTSSFPLSRLRPRIEPFGRLETTVNYYRTQHPANWHTGVPVWRGIRYKDLYPGVDLEVSGESGDLAWRLVCGANCQSALQKIELRVEGADAVSLEDGALRLSTAIGDFSLPLITADATPPGLEPAVSQTAPRTFDITTPYSSAPQSLRSLAPTVPQDSAGALLASTFVGGDDLDAITAVAVDKDGAVYVTGYTGSVGLYWPECLPGVYDLAALVPQGAHTGPIFVAKFEPDLGADSRVYMTFLGDEYQSHYGWITEVGEDIVVDSAGNAYVTGYTVSNEFPATTGAFDTVLNDGRTENCPTGWSDKPCPDAFAAKLSASGQLVYATYLGGAQLIIPGLGNNGGDDYGRAIAVDQHGYIYVVGETDSDDFPTTSGAYDRVFSYMDIGLNPDVFVVKLNPAGNGTADLLYSTYVGSGFVNSVGDVAVDGAGLVHVTGQVEGRGDFVIEPKIDFPTTPNAYDTTAGCITPYCAEGFFFKLNPANQGAADLVYGTYLGGTKQGGLREYEKGAGITLDTSGAVYVLGTTNAPDYPTTPGAFMETPPYGSDKATFISKLNPAGNGAADMAYSTYLGGNGEDWGSAIAVDNGSGDIYVTGYTDSSTFPFTPGAFDSTLNGMDDAFVTRLSPQGAGVDDLVYSTYLGGTYLDSSYGVALAEAGTVYVVGSTHSVDFPSTPGAYDPNFDNTSCGSYPCNDGFISKLATEYATISGQVTDNDDTPLSGIAVSANGAYHTTTASDGSYTLANLPPGTYTVTLSSDYFWMPEQRVVTVPPDVAGQNFAGRNIVKEVTPAAYQGTLRLGDRLTYTVHLIFSDSSPRSFYDAIPTYTTYVSETLVAPSGVVHDPGTDAITGPLTFTPTVPFSVTFAVRVGVTGTVGLSPRIVNRACVHPAGGSLEDCEWSNEVRSYTYLWPIYLPLALRNH